ncbi:MAG TPA: TadE/TadG family type IV pilus assembly protein [Syntrophomonadaceae bacterium]|nr:TadE/TadG family type IV pilus assembly protein [Syntrophomonadaceae bacterium]
MRSLIKDEKAQAMVEMALALPVLILLSLGIFDFGRVFGSYLVVNNLAREGARYGVVGHSDSEILAAVNSEAAFLDITRLTVTPTPAGSRARGTTLKISVSYTVPLVMPLVDYMIPNPFPLSSSCYMRVEQ